MNRKPEELKQRITSLFDKSKYTEYMDIDPGIKELMREINSYPHIMTTHSCEGHEVKDEISGWVSHTVPYFSFLVNDIGWNLFWTRVVPILASGEGYARIKTNIYETGGKDYSAIAVYGMEQTLADSRDKKVFWKLVKRAFKELK